MPIRNNAPRTWTSRDDEILISMYKARVRMVEICQKLGRAEGAARNRLAQLRAEGRVDYVFPRVGQQGHQ
jgi:predicted transcriptional regulator